MEESCENEDGNKKIWVHSFHIPLRQGYGTTRRASGLIHRHSSHWSVVDS
jgi:hypothetical protein